MQCPLCLGFQFHSLDALRDALIGCAARPISCPLCGESLRGLDKFTAHLFAHLLSSQAHAQMHWPVALPPSPAAVDEDSLMTLLQCQETMTQETMTQETVSQETMSCEQAMCVQTMPCLQLECQQAVPMEDSVESGFGNAATQEAEEAASKRPFACFRCSKAFRTRGSLLVHMRIAHNAPRHANPPPQPASAPASPEPAAAAAPSGKAWECATCRKRFSTKYFLAKHQRLHTGETPYACAVCAKSFTFQQSLHKHLLYHTELKPHACADCGRCFKELSTLANHRRIHSGEKPFPCDTCGKRFRQRVSWLVHRRIHTGALPYECTSCTQRFRYKVSQRTHKCPAQPPGSVVRAPSDLLARLMAAQQGAAVSPAQCASPSRTQCADASITQCAAPSITQCAAPSITQCASPSSSQCAGPSSTSCAGSLGIQCAAPSITQCAGMSITQCAGPASGWERAARRAAGLPVLHTIDEESLRKLLDSTSLVARD